MILRRVASRQGSRLLARPQLQAERRTCRRLLSQIDSTSTSASDPVDSAPIAALDDPVLPSSTNAVEPGSTLQYDTAAPPDRVSKDYHAFQHHRKTTQHFGSSIEPHYRPHELTSNPPRPSEITLELLLASQSHLGHATRLWNPSNARYIYGVRQGIHIISLDSTAAHLRRACTVVRNVAERAGIILFVGTRHGQSRCITKAAELSGGCHLFTRWVPGSITNSEQILGHCARKIVDEHDRVLKNRFEEQLRAHPVLKPDLVVCLNPLENYVLLHECALVGIPTIGVIDTDVDPTWVTYPIPANDDSLRCIQVIAGVLGRAGEEGQARRAEAAREGRLTYGLTHKMQPPTMEQEEEEAAALARENVRTAGASPASASARQAQQTQQTRIDSDGGERSVDASGSEIDSEAADRTDRRTEPVDLALLVARKRRFMREALTDADRAALGLLSSADGDEVVTAGDEVVTAGDEVVTAGDEVVTAGDEAGTARDEAAATEDATAQETDVEGSSPDFQGPAEESTCKG